MPNFDQQSEPSFNNNNGEDINQNSRDQESNDQNLSNCDDVSIEEYNDLE